MRTLRTIGLIVLLATGARAATVLSHETVRVGEAEPVRDPHRHGEIDAADLALPQSPPRDPVLTVKLDKDVYERGEKVRLTAKLRRKDDRVVEDVAITAVLDNTKIKQLAKSPAGEHETLLDDTPGLHGVEVHADAVIDGTSVHRVVTASYIVATGSVRIEDRGQVWTDATTVHVPLQLSVVRRGSYQVEGTLVAGRVRVAYARLSVSMQAGPETVELVFNRADLAEPGPYRLRQVQVTENGPEGERIATAPADVGKPFDVR